MPQELEFNKTSELNFTHDINDLINGMIPDPDDTEIDWKEIEDFLYDDNAEKIYSFLTDKFCHRGFSDYLKRYIYRQARMTGSFNSIPDKEYQKIIIESFRDNLTDFSFYPTKARDTEVTANWLKRKMVSRETVLLLGFGLKMSLDDVNEFLHKGLHEPLLDPKEPLEAVCRYCFRKQYPYPRFRKIWDRFDPDHPTVIISGYNMDSTAQCREALDAIDNDGDMLAYLYDLPRYESSKRQSLTARKEFDRLYSNIQEGLRRRNCRDEVAESGILPGKGDNEKADEKEEEGKAAIENVLYVCVPRTESNNYAPLSGSSLKDLFYKKRFNRQHIGEILKGEAPISRFDLITMCFLDYDLKRDGRANVAKEHYKAFVEETNAVLKKCNMEELYVSNPYECMIILCMKTESPIEVYAEIWGMSYDEQ